MRATEASALVAMATIGVMAFWPGTSAAGPQDLNPVLSAMPEMTAGELQRFNGRGAVDDGVQSALQNATVNVTAAGAPGLPTSAGSGGTTLFLLPSVSCGACSNDLGSAFAGASAVAAITQNNGSYSAINNLVLVETHMHQ